MIWQLEKEIIRNIRNIPKVPLSLLLSGGIDSSLVLALIKKASRGIPIHTFSLARNENYPDLAYAREVAEMFETDHHEIILSNPEYEEFKREHDKVKEYNFKGDVNVYILCSIASEYSRVIVTGDGGDECFGGYWLHKYPLGHKENGRIKCFKEIHPSPKKHIEEMVRLGFRNFYFKEKSMESDYNAVWEYFMEIMAPRHLSPLLHIGDALDINIYTPLFSDKLTQFLRCLPFQERVDRKIERELSRKYLPQAVIERESIGFDIALDADKEDIRFLEEESADKFYAVSSVNEGIKVVKSWIETGDNN